MSSRRGRLVKGGAAPQAQSENQTKKRKNAGEEHKNEPAKKKFKPGLKQNTNNSNPPTNTENNALELKTTSSTPPPSTEDLIKALMKNREARLLFAMLFNEKPHWATLTECNLGKPYTENLPDEPRLFNQGLRHFFLWSIYPETEDVATFNTKLSTSAAKFLDGLQQFADKAKGRGAFNKLQTYVLGKFANVAKHCPPDFDQFIYSAWTKLKLFGIANTKKWGELDWCKNVYALIDELMLRSFDTRSNRTTVFTKDKTTKEITEEKRKPDFQVSKTFAKRDVLLLAGEDDPEEHSAIEHKDTYKLIEIMHDVCGANSTICAVPTYGVLNGGSKCTILRAEYTTITLKIAGEDVVHPRYNFHWIKDDEEDYTFRYSFDNFAKMLKTLAALYFHLQEQCTKIKEALKNHKKIAVTNSQTIPKEKRSSSMKRKTLSLSMLTQSYARNAEGESDSNEIDSEEDDSNDREDKDGDEDEPDQEEDEDKDDTDQEEDEDKDESDQEEDDDESYQEEDPVKYRRHKKDDEDEDGDRNNLQRKRTAGTPQNNVNVRVNQNQSGALNYGKKGDQSSTGHRKKKDFTHLFSVGSRLINRYGIEEQSDNIAHLYTLMSSPSKYIAKWSHSEGLKVPYEVEVISQFPLKTIPQPIEWCSVDNNQYHLIIWEKNQHVEAFALQKFVYGVRAIIASLEYMHKRNFVHGDVKFNNSLYVMTRGPQLIDFDCSHYLDSDEWEYFGTNGHRAPEQILRGEYTIRSEMYSVGIWLIEWFFQRSLQTILAAKRPNFSSEENEIETAKVLLEVFEEYINANPYEKMWRIHLGANKGHLLASLDPCLTIEQFNTLKVMIRDLLSQDPAKRPTCTELLHGAKYKPFFGDTTTNWLVIPKKDRRPPLSHVIESQFACKARELAQAKNKGNEKPKRAALRNITNLVKMK